MQNIQQFRVAICDDTPADLAEITKMTEHYFSESGVSCRISGFGSAQSLYHDIVNGEQYHLLLLDVVMDPLNGMDLARQLRQMNITTDIVFISSNREMALRGYEVGAARYLAKPLTEEKHTEALGYCCKMWRRKKEILLPTDQGGYRIPLSDIRYAEAFERGTRFLLMNEAVESRLKFSEVRALLPEDCFITCHRAYIVSIPFIKYIRPYEFVLKNGETVPISKARYPEIRRKFVSYIAE